MASTDRTNWAALFDAYAIPDNLRDGLKRYLLHGTRPGGFLVAVLENDLKMAILRSHPSLPFETIQQVTRLLIHEAPGTCFGDARTVCEWTAMAPELRPPMPHDTGRFRLPANEGPDGD